MQDKIDALVAKGLLITENPEKSEFLWGKWILLRDDGITGVYFFRLKNKSLIATGLEGTELQDAFLNALASKSSYESTLSISDGTRLPITFKAKGLMPAGELKNGSHVSVDDIEVPGLYSGPARLASGLGTLMIIYVLVQPWGENFVILIGIALGVATIGLILNEFPKQ